jgi:phospholipase C
VSWQSIGRCIRALLVFTLVLSALCSGQDASEVSTSNRQPHTATTNPQLSSASDISQIQHIIFIIKENRSFDHYFGTYPGADGATTGQISTGQVIQLGHMPDVSPRDICHTWDCALTSENNGLMNQFDLEKYGNINGDYLAYKQMYQSDIPNYWTYAQNFVLADRMFSSLNGPSFSNHLFTIAAQSAGTVGDPNSARWGCDADPTSVLQLLGSNGTFPPAFPCFEITTLADSLNAAGISWRYYAPPHDHVGYEWSAYDAVPHIRYSSQWTQNVVPDTQFISDALSGNLPAVSWLITGDASEHPPQSTCFGENWTVQQLNALMQGPAWNSTAVFITWDDYGGFYDHVPPPGVDQYGLSIRVPLLIVSPFSIPGYISHTQYEFSSLLKFVETRFNLPALTARDAAANDMTDSFNFLQQPLPPLILEPRSCPAGVSIWPTNFYLAYQPVNHAGIPVQIDVTNPQGGAPLYISSIGWSGKDPGDFSETDNCVSSSPLSAGATCTIVATFKPKAAGYRSANIVINDSGPGAPHLVDLNSSGFVPTLTTSPGQLTFGVQTLGTTSPSQAIVVSNTGTSPVSVSSIVMSEMNGGDFHETDTCTASPIPASGGTCTINVTFTPTGSGTRIGTLNITDNGLPTRITVNLTGTGSSALLTPQGLTWKDQIVGTTSAVRTIKLTNTSTTSVLNVSNVALNGGNSSDFVQNNNCTSGSPLPPAGYCTITLTFKPSLIGAEAATLSVSDDGGGSPQTVSLSGTGTIVKLSAKSISFGTQVVNTTSLPSSIVLTNASTTTALTVKSVAIVGTNASDFAESNNCISSSPIAPGATCSINATFTPKATGNRTATLKIYDNGGGSPQFTTMSGTGQ